MALILANLLIPASAQVNSTTETKEPFNHSDCQYPDRWSNPPNGCDNSDPAVPECIKAFSTKEAEAECIAEFVKAHEQPKPDPVQPAPAAPVTKTNTCEGK